MWFDNATQSHETFYDVNTYADDSIIIEEGTRAMVAQVSKEESTKDCRQSECRSLFRSFSFMRIANNLNAGTNSDDSVMSYDSKSCDSSVS